MAGGFRILLMKFVLLKNTGSRIGNFLKVFIEFNQFLLSYSKKNIVSASVSFEKNKNRLVKLFLIKRGRYNRPFLHFATMSVLFLGVILGPFLADTYPIFASNTSQVLGSQTQTQTQSIDVSTDVFETKISKKPRDKVETYTVQKGDTVGSIARRFEISVDTIKWANDLSSDDLAIGDKLKILPVTGLSVKVAAGDTIYSIAKRYATEPQKIADFPFNDFANPETFSLVEGQLLIVPDGVKPSEQSNYASREQVYIVQGPIAITNSGFTWPLRGGISQFASWYHMALDITSPVGTAIVAAQDGVVTKVDTGSWDYGYGNNLYITGENNTVSHYAHLSGVNVSAGQHVTAGQTVIGWVGMSGRTTGPHLHFEISQNGVLIDPMSFLR